MDSHYFSVHNGTLQEIIPGEMQPYAEVYTPGDIYIEDILGSTSGKIVADSKELVGQAALNTAITIISNIPQIGSVVSTVSSVIGTLKPLYSALSSIDYSKSYTVSTWYSYRNFTHRILMYTNAGTWKEVGSSLSRYYYKHLYTCAYSRSTGDYYTAAYDFTHSNGYSPAEIAEAPNYMNYTALAQLAREANSSNLTYRETYRD